MIGAKSDIVVGIDPDVEKSGLALLDVPARDLKLFTLSFPDLLDALRTIQRNCQVSGRSLAVVIEAGWINKAHWHLSPKDTKQMAAAKGNSAGRNHETGRKIAEMCGHWQIPYVLQKPLQLRSRGRNIWKGKDGKITAEELRDLTGLTQRTNQEARDAALIAWEYAGMPMRINLRK